jgi:hypothetical protein
VDSERTVKETDQVKIQEKSRKKIHCGEKDDCPLRSKCKAGVCRP